MPKTAPVAVKDLVLDLGNFRTLRQTDERSAIAAMITTRPDRFWALAGSLLESGYLPTESVIVLRVGKQLVVKEGNRRVAALKLIQKHQPMTGLDLPDDIADGIKKITPAWRKANASVPCTIFEASEADQVDRIVTLAHGKGEKAGRDQWNAVARARHNRDAKRQSEPALDLLEKYLQNGQNLTPTTSAQWSGEFPLTVLEELMKRVAPRLGLASANALATKYPNVNHRGPLEAMIHDVGQGRLGFDRLRSKEKDFAEAYGVPALTSAGAAGGGKGGGQGSGGSSAAGKSGATAAARRKQAAANKAIATGDPRAVKRLMQDFAPVGKNRSKLVQLRDEIVILDLRKTPIAYCFVLRSMFELSAMAYCADHAGSGGPKTVKSDGQNRDLADILTDIKDHLIKNSGAAKVKAKELHGATTELGKGSRSVVSITSLNQLVHNPKFTIAASDLPVAVANVFPLLEAMNS